MELSGLLLQQRPWPELRDKARRWDASDARALYVADHLRGSPRAEEATWFDAIALLGSLAAATERIRLGTLVASVTLRDPVMLALAARSLDHLSAGRFELGIGAGGRPSDETMRGLEPLGPWERAARLGDAVWLIDRLLRGEAVEHATGGNPGRATLAGENVAQPRPSLLVAAHGPQTVEVAARYGDAWSASGMRQGTRQEQLAELTRLSGLLDEALDRIERPRAAVRRSVLVGVYPGLTYRSFDELFDLAGEMALIGFDELVIYDPPFALDSAPAPDSVIDEALSGLAEFRTLL